MDAAGAVSPHFNGPGVGGPAGVKEHGIGTGGFSRNLGGPARLHAIQSGSGDRMRTPGPWSAFWTTGSEASNATHGNAKRRKRSAA